MTDLTFLLELAAAFGVGALVGIEREHRRDETRVIAGVRTFPLVAASGFLSAFFSLHFDAPIILASGVLVMGLGALGILYVRATMGSVGFTTPMALIVTFLAGALIGIGLLLEGLVVAVATTFLLLTKERLHRLAQTLDQNEVMGALQFVALAFVALPLAAAAEGPYLGDLVGRGRPIDPRWTLVIVVAASSLAFISFIAMRRLGGRRGLAAAGALGGLVNSEAATASVATLARGGRGLEAAAGAAVLAATATMLVRNLVLVGIAEPRLTLLPGLALVLLPAIAVVGAGAWMVARRAPPPDRTVHIGLRSPFAIRPALGFAVVFAGINAAAFVLQDLLGPVGVYATSIGAVVSSGAVVASVASLVFTGTIPLSVGLVTAALASVVSILSKLFVLSVTNRTIIGHVVVPLVVAALAAVVTLLVVL